MNKVCWIICLFLLLFLAGCKPAELHPPLPSPQFLQIGIIPSLKPVLQDRLTACEKKINGLAVLVNVQPSHALNVYQSDIIFQIGDIGLEGNVYPFQVGQAEVVLIAHPTLELDTLNLDLIRAYYTTSQTNIQTWTYPRNHELRFLFDHFVLDSQDTSPTSFIAPGPLEMNQAISQTPNAIGYTLRSWLTEEVQEIHINASLQDSLRQPILAVTSKYPQGIVKEFLACVQSLKP